MRQVTGVIIVVIVVIIVVMYLVDVVFVVFSLELGKKFFPTKFFFSLKNWVRPR